MTPFSLGLADFQDPTLLLFDINTLLINLINLNIITYYLQYLSFDNNKYSK